MKVTFQSVESTFEKKGKGAGYNKAVVIYTYNGEPRKQTIVSFKNPEVYKAVTSLTAGTEIEVETFKNDAGFSEWKSVTAVGAAAAPVQGYANSAPATNKVVGSNYETREERANRQVLIVRQNALTNAVAALTPGAKTELDTATVLEKAREFADWVLAKDTSVESLDNDIPF